MYEPNKLKAAIVESGTSGRTLAHQIGISEKQFYRKLSNGKWYPNEITSMSKYAGWDEDKTVSIFLR